MPRQGVILLAGSQTLYGPEVLANVKERAAEIALFYSQKLDVDVLFGEVMVSPEQINQACEMIDSRADHLGAIVWCPTFSPAQMWIPALRRLKKPVLQLHTQYGQRIPEAIDMNYMNEHQSAHGDRELGHGFVRAGKPREIVVGHWATSKRLLDQIQAWVSVAKAWNDWQTLKIAMIGGKMRDVAVTDGDPVEAQKQFGFEVQDFPTSDLVAFFEKVAYPEAESRARSYCDLYETPQDGYTTHEMNCLKEAAAVEIALERFLRETGCNAFTTCFQSLEGLPQLPGIGVQRLMSLGYGFGPEGDWKVAALVRALTIMGGGHGSSLMEHYTYDFTPGRDYVLGAHMLEISPAIAEGKPRLVVAPLSIGGKNDPARLVFSARTGMAINLSLVDLGHRFRFISSEVMVSKPPEMPKLPVAHAFWEPQPTLITEATAWMMAGGAHHTAFSLQVNAEQLRSFARMVGVELAEINGNTELGEFERNLFLADAAYRLSR